MCLLPRLLCVFPVCILTLSCASHDPYRTSVPKDGGTPCLAQGLPDSCDETAWTNTAWETWKQHKASYDLFYVEFDDQGLLHPHESYTASSGDASRQLEAIDDALRRYQEQKECINLVVYVHGWKHDARTTDGDVKEFRKLMRFEALLETKTPDPHKAVGILVGWRGLSATKEPFKELSFWNRKKTASKVAAGSARDLFTYLHAYEQTRNAVWEGQEARVSSPAENTQPRMATSGPCVPNPRAKIPGRAPVRMLIIGHSFGAQIVYESISPYLIASLGNEPDARTHRYGDMVVLLEPAFEATRFTPLFYMARHATDATKTSSAYHVTYQAPLLVSITSTADFATRHAFQWGRYFSMLFQNYASKEERSADLHTIGFMDDYITHELRPKSKDGEIPACKNWEALGSEVASEKLERDLIREGNAAVDFFKGYTRNGETELEGRWVRSFCGDRELGGTELRFVGDPKINANIPIWNVRTYKRIIPGHTEIEGEALESFVRQIYRDSICYSGLPSAAANSSNEGLECEKRMNDVLAAQYINETELCGKADVIAAERGQPLSPDCTKKFDAAMTPAL